MRWAACLFFAVMLQGVTFRSDSALVVVNVSVVDSHDRPVSGLEQRQFQVFDNGQEQPIAFFAHEDTPVSAVLILDLSGSMEGKLGKARAMVSRFCSQLEPGDEAAVFTVGKTASLASDFASECGEIPNRFLFAKAAGFTPLLDAIPLAAGHLKRARNERKAILIVSDGGENASRMRPADIRRLVRESRAPVYAAAITESSVAFPDGEARLDEIRGPQLLREIAAESGGRYFEANFTREAEDAATRIAAEMHDRYVIGYRAPDTPGDGRFRRVSLRVKRDPGLPRVTLFYRAGYYGIE